MSDTPLIVPVVINGERVSLCYGYDESYIAGNMPARYPVPAIPIEVTWTNRARAKYCTRYPNACFISQGANIVRMWLGK